VRRFNRRDELVKHLVEELDDGAELVVGLDFAFSLPFWFLEDRGCTSAQELWLRMSQEVDRWLAPEAPFWETAGAGPELSKQFRQTDDDVRAQGWSPSSAFKLVGPSQVGRGSLRGMRHLVDLERAGFNIWPFDAGLPLVVEIYPAALADFKGKGDPQAIAEAVKENRAIGRDLKAHAACSQDAFDAAMSALRMAHWATAFAELAPAPKQSRYFLEGQIWMPPGG
jgi:hypothetical protein